MDLAHLASYLEADQRLLDLYADADDWARQVILNAHSELLDFELPRAGEGDTSSWRRWIDTALESPQDIVPWQMAAEPPGPTYQAAAHSVVVLFGEIRRGATLT
jgi:isoamylase